VSSHIASPWGDPPEPLLDGPLSAQIEEARSQLLKAAQSASASANPGYAAQWVATATEKLDDLLDKYRAKLPDLVALEAPYRERRAKLEASALDFVQASEVKTAANKAYTRILGEELARKRREQELAEASGSSASWQPADLTPYLDGEITEPVPTVLTRTDGKALFYVGLNTIFGDSGSGKSLIMCTTVAQELAAGRVCVWLDYEEATPATTVSRLLALGATREQIGQGLVWVHPDTPVTAEMLAQVADAALALAADDRVVSLLVIDSVGEALAADGLNEDKDADVGPWTNRVRTVLPRLPDCSVILVDHSVKARDGAGRLHPSGSKRKRAALTGIAWLAETVTEFSKHKAGAVQLVCAKDRHGNYLRGDVGAVVRVAPDASVGALNVTVGPPVLGLVATGLQWSLVVQVHEVIKKDPGVSMNKIEGRVTGHGSDAKRAARDFLVSVGAVAQEKKGTGFSHTVTRELTHADSEALS
jgi:hypothetical protein